MTDTPETDAAHHACIHGGDRFSFPEHARRMERERNQWKAIAIELERHARHSLNCKGCLEGFPCECGSEAARQSLREALR